MFFFIAKVRGDPGSAESVEMCAELVRPAGADGSPAALLRVPAAVSQRRGALGLRQNPSLFGSFISE